MLNRRMAMFRRRSKPVVRSLRWVLFAASCAAAGMAQAHHSYANYDMAKEVTIKGTVQKFDFVNPHSFMVLNITDKTGKAEQYQLFIASKSVMVRTGWRPDSVKVGDAVSVTGALDRHNLHDVFLWDITFADGKKWTFRTVVNAK